MEKKEKTNKEKIEEIVSVLVGERSLPVVNYLLGKKDVSEFLLEKELEIDLTSVRKVLYKLQNLALVTYKRKKDLKRGWYVAYWTFKPNIALNHSEMLMKDVLNDTSTKLAYELANTFYVCSDKCERLTHEEALENNYHCPICNKIMKPYDNSEYVDHLKTKLSKLSMSLDKQDEVK